MHPMYTKYTKKSDKYIQGFDCGYSPKTCATMQKNCRTKNKILEQM